MNISVRSDPSPILHTQLTLIKVTDESGREAEISPQEYFNVQEQSCGFKPPPGAKQLNFTFALHKSRFVEFMTKPEDVRARAN